MNTFGSLPNHIYLEASTWNWLAVELELVIPSCLYCKHLRLLCVYTTTAWGQLKYQCILSDIYCCPLLLRILILLLFSCHICIGLLKLTSLDKMAAILADDNFECIFLNENNRFQFEFHWMFLTVQLTITQHWFRYWLWAHSEPSHYLNQCWPDSLTYICGTRGGR